jgi:dCMP deaminase
MPRQEQFDEAYLLMAETWGQLSKAERKKVGCLVVKDGQIISDGYNGTPAGYDNVCETENEGFHPSAENKLETKPEVLHAESNALMKLAKSTNSSEGSTVYLTMSPCFECSKLMIQAGVKRLVYSEKYRNESGIKFLNENKIETCFFPINEASLELGCSKTYSKLSETPKHPEWLT